MRLTLLLLIAASMTGCMFARINGGIPGSGKITQVDHQVAAFSRIENQAAVHVVVKVGSAQTVRSTIDENLVKYLAVEVVGDELVIRNTESIRPTKGRIEVTVPSLAAFIVTGAGDAEITGISGDKFEAKIDGAGSVSLEGQAKSANLSIEGAGSISGAELKAERVIAQINGAGSIEVNASTELDAKIGGAGSIFYKGSPKVTQSVDGAGAVKPL